MKKLFVSFIAVLTVILLFSDVEYYGNDILSVNDNKATLKVISYTPSSKTVNNELFNEITLLFSQKILPLEHVQDLNVKFSIEPPLKGYFRSRGTETLVFIPSEEPDPSIEYTFTLNKGIMSIDSNVMLNDFTFAIKPVRLTVLGHNLKYEQFPNDTAVFITFNYSVPVNELKKHLTFSNAYSKNEISFNIKEYTGITPYVYLNEHAKKHAFTVKIMFKDTLNIESSYQMAFYYPGFMNSTYSYTFNTFNRFKYKGNINLNEINYKSETAFDLYFSNRVDSDELIKNVFFINTETGEKEKLPIKYGYRYSSKSYYIYHELLPKTQYFIEINKGLKDIFDNNIENPGTYSIKTGNYYPFIQFDDYYLYTIDPPLLHINGMNWNFCDIYIDFLSTNDFINFYTDDFMFKVKNIFKSFQKKRYEFPVSENQMHSISVDINNEFKGSGWLGRGFVRYYWHYSSYTDTIDIPFVFQHSKASTHMILSPRNGLAWSIDRGSEQLMYPGKLILFDSGNRQIARFSLKKGIYNITKRDMKLFDSENYKPNFLYTMLADNNNILPYYYSKTSKHTVHYTFTDRNLYTLNDTVHISGIIRNKDANRIELPEFTEMNYSLQGPDYSVVKEGKVFIDKDGTYHLEIFIPDSFKTGYYYCYFDRNAYTSFSVQEFRQPKFEININSEKAKYKYNEKLNINVNADYLTGQKMSGDSLELLFSPYMTYFYTAKAPGFTFNILNDTLFKKMPYDTVFSVLNNEGSFEYREKVNLNNHKNPLSFTVTGTVQSIDKESISGNTYFQIFPRNDYAGIKLMRMSDDSAALMWTVISTGDDFIKNKKISVKILSSVNYDFFNADTIVNKTVKNSTDIDTLIFQYDKSLHYKTIVYYDKCRIETYLYSYYYSYETEQTSPYFITDKSIYDIGDTAIVKIIPPQMEGSIMIFWGTDSIYGSSFESMTGDTIIKHIKIIEDFVSGFYLATATMSEDIRNDHSLNQHFISVSNETKNIECTIETDKKEYQPGDSITLSVNTNTNENVHAIISVIDESVLMLTNYSWYNPLSRFYSSYSSYFNYYSTYNITSNYYDYRNGGGNYDESFDGMMKKSMSPMVSEKTMKEATAACEECETDASIGINEGIVSAPEIRTDFKKTAFFSEKTILKKGKGNISFKLPDNTTKYRVSIILIQNDKFGFNSAQFTAKKKIMIEHTLPMFLRPFDRLRLSFAVIDDTENNENITAGIYETDMTLISDKTEIKTPENGKCEFRFDGSSPFADSVNITLFAEKGKFNDYVKVSIPVISHNLYEHSATFSSTEDSAMEIINIDESIIRSGSEIDISMNSSQIAQIKLPLQYLEDYKYHCLEQRISRILPFVIGEELINNYNMSEIKGKKLRNYVNGVIKDVDKYQSSNGGFRYYTDSYYTSEYLSIYTMYVLYHARENNYKISEDVINGGLAYLERIVYSDFESIWDYSKYARLSLKCNAIYVLSLYGRMDYQNQLNDVYDNRDFLYLSSRGRLLETLTNYKNNEKAEILYSELLSSIKIESIYAYFDDGRNDWWMFQNELKNSAVVLKSLLSFNSNFEYADKITNFFAHRIKEGMWVNTHTTALVLEALQVYFTLFENEYPNFDAIMNINGKNISKDHFKGRNDKMVTHTVSGFELEQGKNILNLIKKGQGRLFYTLRFKYARKGKIEPLFNGFNVTKTFYDLSNNKVTTFIRGQFYRVSIKINTNKSRTFVTIDDPLPAGFDIVKRGFVTEKLNLTGSNYNKQWWGGFYHEEFYKDRAIASATYLYKGEHEYSYYVKAYVSGDFSMPPTNVFEMYTPEVFGHTGSRFINIE